MEQNNICHRWLTIFSFGVYENRIDEQGKGWSNSNYEQMYLSKLKVPKY